MSIKVNLFKNAGAGVWARISIVTFRLVQVPLLLSYLGVANYGRWLVLYSLPSWLILANFGFGNVASNEMSMAVASGNIEKAKSLFSTTFALMTAIAAIGLGISFIVVPLISWENFLTVGAEKHRELSNTVILLTITIFASFPGELFGGRFVAAKKAHTSIIISGFRPWIELLIMFITLKTSTRYDVLALSMLGSMVINFLVMQWLSFKALPDLTFSLSKINRSGFKDLFRKGIAYQAFPLGNALLFQGSLFVVQVILGPVAVAIFGTARTLVRTVNQAMDLINQTVAPELTYLFGVGNKIQASKLHRTAVSISLLTANVGVIFLIILGPILYKFWVGKSIILSLHLLLLFLFPIPFNALWVTSSVVHMACNQHEGLAKRYFVASILSILSCGLLSYFQGIEGAALSTLVADLVLIPYVFKNSLLLTGDTWKGFINGILEEGRNFSIQMRKLLRMTT